MALPPPTLITIDHDPVALAAVFDEVAASGSGWVNVVPEIPEGTPVPATPNGLALFNRRGPVVPLGTWTPPVNAKRGTTPAEIGLQHGTSMKGTEALASANHPVPESWAILTDHPRKGTALRPPVDTSTLTQAGWLIDAVRVLCLPPQTGRFVVGRYQG